MPPSGQSWTTLGKMKTTYKNEIKQDKVDGRIWSIFSTPQFAIGQRAIFIQTEAGNVLWDCISLLDAATIDFIRLPSLTHTFTAAISSGHASLTVLFILRQRIKNGLTVRMRRSIAFFTVVRPSRFCKASPWSSLEVTSPAAQPFTGTTIW